MKNREIHMECNTRVSKFAYLKIYMFYRFKDLSMIA